MKTKAFKNEGHEFTIYGRRSVEMTSGRVGILISLTCAIGLGVIGVVQCELRCVHCSLLLDCGVLH